MTEKKQRAPLKPGDKIKFEGALTGSDTYYDRVTATVLAHGQTGSIAVDVDDINGVRRGSISRRQVVSRLRPPRQEKERVVYGVNAPRLELYAWCAGHPESWLCSRERPELGRGRIYYRVVGCSTGEKPISREVLEEAWNVAAPNLWKTPSVQFDQFVHCLGFEGGGK